MKAQRHTLTIALAAALAASALAPGEAHADLYRYLQKDGTVLITNTPQKGLKLLEHLRDDGSSSSSSSGGGGSSGGRTISKKFQRSRERAEAARDNHTSTRSAEGDAATSREERYDHIIREAAKTYQLPFAFIKGVIKVESNFHPLVISPVGAQGLMQLMPATADFLGVEDAFDPRQNIFGGARLLRILTNRYNGDINLLLSAYNAGEGAVDRYDGIPYAQTREYVRRVYHFYKVYQQQELEAARD